MSYFLTGAVGAGDVDEAEFVLRIAGQRGEPARVFQPEVRAEQLQPVKKLDGSGVGHATPFQITAACDECSGARRR